MSDFSPLREAVDTLASRAPSPEFGELKRRAAHRGRRRVAFMAAATVAVIAGTVLASSVVSVDRRADPAGPPAATIEQPNQIPTPTPTPTMEANLTLRGDGIGPFTFGAKQVDVAAVLHDRLGYPVKQSEQGILCPLEGSPWGQFVNYGGLAVYYTAKDQSQWSPRYLVAWSFPLNQKLPAALTMQDDVPLNLTYKQLKAKYPAGKLENFNDGSRGFKLPNKLGFGSNPGGSKPEVVGAGQGSPCPDLRR